MNDEFMGDWMAVCREQELIETIDLDSIIEDFYLLIPLQAQLK